MAIPDNGLWREFFQLYKEFPELWPVKSAIFKDKVKKKNAIQKLLEKYKEIEPSATVDSLKKRLNNIKTCFRRELKKIETSKKSGAGCEELYVSTLWYFEELEFLRDQETQLSGVSTINLENGEESAEEAAEAREGQNRAKMAKTMGQHLMGKNLLLKDALQHLKDKQEDRDEASVYAEGWAVSYCKLSPTQKIFAKRAVDEILMLGQLEQLTLNSVVAPSSSPSSSVPSLVATRASTPITQHHHPYSSFERNFTFASGSPQEQSFIISTQILLISPITQSQSPNITPRKNNAEEEIYI